MPIRCVLCDQSFESGQALQEHKRNSLPHAFDCTSCDRHFGSGTALLQHIRDSPAHPPFFDCEYCGRLFDGEDALEQHMRDSPAHAPSFDCETCDRAFGSEDALEHHMRHSPAHALSFDCETCNRAFGSEEALEQHLRDSPVHQQTRGTPLDVFFLSFRTFVYDPSLPPATSYAHLQQHKRWRRGDAESDRAWNKYQDALNGELLMWYGAENDLTAWHALCRAIGVAPLPHTCERCEEAVRRKHVNIVDLIEWGRSGNNKKRVRTFRSVVELRAYTINTRKIFRNTLGQEGGNVVLRHLLRKIF